MMSSRPPHQITAREAAAWLRGSAVEQIVVHRTDPVPARAIRERGVDLGQASSDLSWGEGFYASSRGEAQFGQVAMRVAIRLERPFVSRDPVRDAETVDDLPRPAEIDDVRAVLLELGHDGVVIHWGPGDFWVVAYDASQVKVVV